MPTQTPSSPAKTSATVSVARGAAPCRRYARSRGRPSPRPGRPSAPARPPAPASPAGAGAQPVLAAPAQPLRRAHPRRRRRRAAARSHRDDDRDADLVQRAGQRLEQPRAAGQGVGGADAHQDRGQPQPVVDRPSSPSAVTGAAEPHPAAQSGSGICGSRHEHCVAAGDAEQTENSHADDDARPGRCAGRAP